MSVKAALLGASVPEETVELGGGSVTVRGLTIHGRDVLEKAMLEGQSFRPALLRAGCYVDGELLFTDDDDVGAIPAGVAEPLIDAALRVSAITPEEAEELEGN